MLRRVLLRKAFQRNQQKGLARARRDLCKVLFRRGIRLCAVGFAVDFDRIPNLGEQTVEGDPMIGFGFQDFRTGDQRFQRVAAT
jgi:hypothetical protein